MGFSDFFTGGTKTKTVKTLTPEQEALLSQLTGISRQYAPEVADYFASVMRGETGLSPEAINQFYQEGVLQPALYEYETRVRPQIEEQFGSRYHSSARAKTLSRTFNDLMTNMAQTRANLQYQGILQNLQARMQAAGAMQSQITQPLGVKAFDTIVQQKASPFQMLTQGLGTAGLLMAGLGSGGLGWTPLAAGAAGGAMASRTTVDRRGV